MRRSYRIASGFIALHLVALTTASIPPPGKLLPVSDQPRSPTDPIARFLTPPVDRAALVISRLEPILYRMLAPVRAATKPYVTSGLGDQQWRMFSNPSTADKYARIDWHVTGPQGTRWLRQMVLPADPEQETRYRHEFRDKAIMAALERHANGVRESGVDPQRLDETSEARRFLRPIVRHFGWKLAQTLGSDERVARTELWYGEAPIPPRGETVPTDVIADRLAGLIPYQHKPNEVSGARPYRESGAVERDGDLSWLLLYIDQP